jgi:hypothetical protein
MSETPSEVPHPQSADDSSAIATCLRLLSCSSDAEKFAGLMIVPRVVNSADTALHERVVEAVGTKFLFRLLATEGSPGMFCLMLTLPSPPASSHSEGNKRDAENVYRTVALRILSSFAGLPLVASSPHLARAAPLLVQVAASRARALTTAICLTAASTDRVV